MIARVEEQQIGLFPPMIEEARPMCSGLSSIQPKACHLSPLDPLKDAPQQQQQQQPPPPTTPQATEHSTVHPSSLLPLPLVPSKNSAPLFFFTPLLLILLHSPSHSPPSSFIHCHRPKVIVCSSTSVARVSVIAVTFLPPPTTATTP
ncbi:hypothetical protein EX30DRAFT_183385 [Ascodesmis nigricans]|uniref:Uncharacterized protein n=1 Tax=Ascodesmis nigricans TaxID=341454 RepID=A0A4S2N045_9PEZI|nr:hypothetical protein EX30DRAFT_183385 [Ascodesmis nigricans]